MTSPFYSILKEPLHFGEWRDNANVKSFHLVFTVGVAPESRNGTSNQRNNSNNKTQISRQYLPECVRCHVFPFRILISSHVSDHLSCLQLSVSALFFFFLPLHRRVVEMQQRCAVLAAIKADADFLRGIPIQRRLDCFQRRRNFLAQRCACREGYPPREIIQKCRCVLYYRCFRYRPFHLNRGFHLV